MKSMKLGTKITLSLSGEKGVVIGKAEYLENPVQYFVRYIAADGRQVENWFNLNALKKAA